jgi:DNA replication protein DnaC
MMTSDQHKTIKQSLETLKLKKIAAVFEEELTRAVQKSIPYSELLERLFSLEAESLLERRIERRIKQAKLPERKLLTDFEPRHCCSSAV